MCLSNTKDVCEGTLLASLRKGLYKRFDWKCSNAQTQMLRHMALHEVTKQNCAQKELPSLLKAINCYWPNSEYPANVTPRVQRRMEALFNKLVLDGIVQSTQLSTGGWASEWPTWTRSWLEMDWMGDTSPPSFNYNEKDTIIDLTGLRETLDEVVPTAQVAAAANPFPVLPLEPVDTIMSDACDLPAALENVNGPITPQHSPFDQRGIFLSQHSASATSFNPTFIQGHSPRVTSVTSFNPTLISHLGNREAPSTPTSCTSFNPAFLPTGAYMTHPTTPPSRQSFFVSGFQVLTGEPAYHSVPPTGPVSFQGHQGTVSHLGQAGGQQGTNWPQSSERSSLGQYQTQQQATSIASPDGAITSAPPVVDRCLTVHHDPVPAVYHAPVSTLPHTSDSAAPLTPDSPLVSPTRCVAAAPSVTSFDPTVLWGLQDKTFSYAPSVSIGKVEDVASSYAPTAVTHTLQQIPNTLSQILEYDECPPRMRGNIAKVQQTMPTPSPTPDPEKLKPFNPTAQTLLTSRVDTWRQNVDLVMIDLSKVRTAMISQITNSKMIKLRIKTTQANAVRAKIEAALLSIREMRRSRVTTMTSMARKNIGLALVKPNLIETEVLYEKLDETQRDVLKCRESILKEVLEVGKHTIRRDGSSIVDDIMRL